MTDFHAAKYHRALDFAERQVAATIERTPDYFPIYTVGGRWHHAGELWTDWTGGFFAGMMWQFVNARRRQPGERGPSTTAGCLEHRQHDRNVHDLGFIFLNTYRPWYELTHDERLARGADPGRPHAGDAISASRGSIFARSSAPSRCSSTS